MYDYFSMELGGTPQQIMISGDETKPVLLFCHGGPGTPTMSFLRKWNQPLMDMFLLITWDQRGCGRSNTKDLDPDTINIDTIRSDTHQLTAYIKQRFNREKIFIMGHSFGATLALSVIKEKPEDYYAYFAVSQFVNTAKNEKACYDFLVGEATKAGDKKVLRKLMDVGAPVDGYYKRPIKDLMAVKQLVSKYKGDARNGNATLSILGMILLSKEYGFLRAGQSIGGIQLSLEKVGLSLRGIAYDETHTKLDIPVYFFSGDYDQLTPQQVLREYFTTIEAPHKELICFKESAHSPLWEEGDKFHDTIRNILASDLFSQVI